MIETKPWPENGEAPPAYPYSKWNVLQWFGNVEGLDPSYEPTWPLWKRKFFWFFRNFMFNFFRFVVGVEDRRLMVMGQAPVFTPVWLECSPASTGFKWTLISTGWLRLPFVSYTGTRVLWYFGWVPSGGRLGGKWNLI